MIEVKGRTAYLVDRGISMDIYEEVGHVHLNNCNVARFSVRNDSGHCYIRFEKREDAMLYRVALVLALKKARWNRIKKFTIRFFIFSVLVYSAYKFLGMVLA